MILKASSENTEEIKELWKTCFKDEDPRYIDFLVKYMFHPEDCFIRLLQGKIVSVLLRNKHAMMFNGRVVQTSMILGVATLPEHRHHGYMHELMKVCLDACEHTELFTLIKSDTPQMYEEFGFRTVYNRTQYLLGRTDVKRVTNFGCSFDPSPIDLLKVYSAYIKRFNGFYARDLDYFVTYKKEVSLMGGKIVAYYNGKNQIQGYASLIPTGNQLKVDEITYLDSVALTKLCNAAAQEKRQIILDVSRAEDLGIIFPQSEVKTYGSTMARLNDADLFAKAFNRRVSTVEEAFAASWKPLNLNESE